MRPTREEVVKLVTDAINGYSQELFDQLAEAVEQGDRETFAKILELTVIPMRRRRKPRLWPKEQPKAPRQSCQP